MQLTDDDFAGLLRRWETDREKSEGRRSPRVLTRRRVTLISDPEDAILGQTELTLLDISRGGVRISHHQGMPVGKRFVLVLAAEPAPFRAICVVRHCEMVKFDLFHIGAEFEGIQ